MKYFLIDRNEALDGRLEVWDMGDIRPCPNNNQFVYAIHDDGNLPNNWRYSPELDTLIDLGDSNSQYNMSRKRELESKRFNVLHDNNSHIVVPLNDISFAINSQEIRSISYIMSNMEDVDSVVLNSLNRGDVYLSKKDLEEIIKKYKNIYKNELLNKIIRGA